MVNCFLFFPVLLWVKSTGDPILISVMISKREKSGNKRSAAVSASNTSNNRFLFERK